MKFGIGRINTYFTALAAALFIGCVSTGTGKGGVELSTIRIHLETNPDNLGMSRRIEVGPEPKQTFSVAGPALGEMHLLGAQLWEGNAGEYAVHLQFDRQGAQMLEIYSMSYRGKRLAIFSQFPHPRWVGTFRMDRRIGDGTLLFRPDATRDEAQRLVSGLNKAVAKIKKSGD
ncbi:MAG: hypothetical protein B9S33_15975 [Pedosphaera sp. Tous-C6FEB]|nr:MAG: hypothetical protein B9S33_15975 [Pedosphaera sp. Tous-C6FEB]